MNKSENWLILYDIRDGRRLRYVEKCVSSYGWRVQFSVFESDADAASIERMKRRLNFIINKEEDSILIIKLCSEDWKKREIYGVPLQVNYVSGNYAIL